MAKYCLKYYALKASIKKQNITIKNTLKIWILNNFGLKLKSTSLLSKIARKKTNNLREIRFCLRLLKKKRFILRLNIKLLQILL